MWKDGLVEPVAADELALVARERQLDIEQVAEHVLRPAPVPGVTNAAESEMGPTEATLIQPQVVEVDVDLHAEVDGSEALERGEGVKGHLRILLAVDGDDVLAAPAEQLV